MHLINIALLAITAAVSALAQQAHDGQVQVPQGASLHFYDGDCKTEDTASESAIFTDNTLSSRPCASLQKNYPSANA